MLLANPTLSVKGKGTKAVSSKFGSSDKLTAQSEKSQGSNNSDEISSDESSSEFSFPNSSDSVEDSNGRDSTWSISKYVKSKVNTSTSKAAVLSAKEGAVSCVKRKSGLSTASKDDQNITSERSGEVDNVSNMVQSVLGGWSGSEITYFRMLHPIFGQNFCSISELIRTKNCFEVYEYANHVIDDPTIDAHSSRQRLLAGKKKKKSMRYENA